MAEAGAAGTELSAIALAPCGHLVEIRHTFLSPDAEATARMFAAFVARVEAGQASWACDQCPPPEPDPHRLLTPVRVQGIDQHGLPIREWVMEPYEQQQAALTPAELDEIAARVRRIASEQMVRAYEEGIASLRHDGYQWQSSWGPQWAEQVRAAIQPNPHNWSKEHEPISLPVGWFGVEGLEHPPAGVERPLGDTSPGAAGGGMAQLDAPAPATGAFCPLCGGYCAPVGGNPRERPTGNLEDVVEGGA